MRTSHLGLPCIQVDERKRPHHRSCHRRALRVADIGYEELLAWSVHLTNDVNRAKAEEKNVDLKDIGIMQTQAAVIEDLLKLTTTLAERVRDVEAHLAGRPPASKRKPEEQQPSDQVENAQQPRSRRN